MKKRISYLLTLVFLLSNSLGVQAVSNDSKDTSGSSNSSKNATIELNFDTFTLEGTVGDKTAKINAYDGTKIVKPKLKFKATGTYTLAIQGTPLVSTDKLKRLDISRIKVKVDEKVVELTEEPKVIVTGKGSSTSNLPVELFLDLTDTGTKYSDYTTLNNIDYDTNFSTTVTLSYIGA